MNVRLLRRVKKHILEEPARLRMDLVQLHQKPGKIEDLSWGHGESRYNEPSKQRIPDCGTIGCIGGWALVLEGIKYSSPATGLERAESILGIRSAEAARELFYVENWPLDLRHAYYEAKTKKRRAEIVAERIEQFIEKHGKKGRAE